MDKRNKRLFSVIVFLFVVGAFIWQLKISDRQAKLGDVGAKEETGNALYIGQIEKHYCSRESAVEVNGILKYLETDLAYAEEVLTRIISRDRDCVLAIHTLGTVHSFKREYSKALDTYQKALNLSPEAAVIYQSIGTVNFRSGEPELAIKNLKKAVELERGMWSAHRGLAVIYKMQGKYQLAKKHYVKVIELSDDMNYVDEVKETVRLLEEKGY